MRKKFVYFFLVPVVALLIVLYFFLDGWVESGLEYGGEKVVGARVEIDNLRLSLSPIGIRIDRLQVANPHDAWKNIFETGKIQFALNFGQLLRNKFIIETMEVNGLVLATKRSTDGSLPVSQQPAPTPVSSDSSGTPRPFAQQAQPVVDAKQGKTPLFDIDRIKRSLNTDSLLNTSNLATLRYADSLKAEIEAANRNWQTTLSSLEQSKGQLAEVETKVKAINVSEIKTIDAAKGALDNLSASYKTITEINSTLGERRTALTNDFNRLSSSVNKIDDFAKADFQNVLSLARLPDLSMKGLSELVLGADLMSQVTKYLSWIDFAREKVPKYSSTPDKESPRRFEGQNIRFPEERSYPKLWIKKILVSGGTDKTQDPDYFYAKGEILDISTDQHITGKPLTVALEGTKGGTTSLSFKASFDRRPEVPVDNYKVNLSGLRVADLSTGRSDFVPSKITNAIAGVSVTVTVPGNRLDSDTKLNFGNLVFVFENQPRSTVERLVREVLESVKSIAVGIRVWRDEKKFDMAFTTDLDDQIAARTKKVLGDELAKIQNDLRNKLNARIAEKRGEVERLLNEKKGEITGRLKSYEGLVNEKVAMAEGKKKELENRIEEEKKKQTEGVKKKAEETIKGLFKKK
ncbi:MAG: TIGR03545 family protein [Bacteroidota bacterium]